MDRIRRIFPSLFVTLQRALAPGVRLPGRQTPAGPVDAPEDGAEAEIDIPRGCGWFDSSHELQAGLSITEHDSPDRVANELPLDTWVTWHLAGQRTPGRATCA
jgi:hypothetical protein